ncbi:MAG: hypothetical protein Q4C65_13605 [Eubacteriales bacterium]|nr:hypothetical protein [Eubacteriales bacterium]
MLLGYTWIQWLFFFYFYSFFGWCFESAYVSILKRKPVNRGFIRGPFLPLYGTGALMMLIVSHPFADSLPLTFLAGCVGATALEYVTGVTMEALFKVRYWDYSNQKFNFQGQICLSSTLAWGVLTVFMTRVLHRPVEALALEIPQGVLTALTMVVSLYFVADFTLSFKAALDLRDVLVKMEQAKQELERMQKRLDVILAVAGENWESVKKGLGQNYSDTAASLAQRRGELAVSIEKRFEKLRELLPKTDQLRGRADELLDLRSRFRLNLERPEVTHFLKDFWKRSMLSGNPNMVSRKFEGALDELKKAAAEYQRGQKKK